MATGTYKAPTQLAVYSTNSDQEILEMRTRIYTPILLFFAFGLLFVQGVYANSPTSLARQAVSGNEKESGQAIAELRDMGPAGLDALFEVYRDQINDRISGNAAETKIASWERISAALDAVSQQRNSYTSRLFWYTDFEKAKAASRLSGKPILSLRLLGFLNEEYSCANSRFFRTVLYANKSVADVLRERFVLHWKSVRPAPRVTVDYGDGRKLERTLTGNSIHYVLDSDGRVIDALPGLYGPQAFLRELVQAEGVGRKLNGLDFVARETILSRFHKDRVEAIGNQWTSDATSIGAKIPESILRDQTDGRSFDARVAARTAMSKMVSEIGIINAISYDVRQLKQVTDEAMWAKIAGLHADDARLDKDSIALVNRQASSESGSGITAEELSRVVTNFERYLAFDTVRNEYTMHSTLHAWLSSGLVDLDVETLNERVYKELFLTPSSDPWLGLYSPDTYTALDRGGISK